jgi:hypothetical protein
VPTNREPFSITRTNSKNYVGVCNICGFTTDRIHNRVRCALILRDHCRIEHDTYTEDLFCTPTGDKTMKAPKPEKDLPAPERLSDYVDHLVVFSDATFPSTRTSPNGDAQCDCLAYVYLDDKKQWKALGETPIWWKGVAFQVREAGCESGEELGGVLVQGTGRNPREWNVGAANAAQLKILAKFEKDNAEPF